MVHKMSSQITGLWRQYDKAIRLADYAGAQSVAGQGVAGALANGDARHAGIWQRALSRCLFFRGYYDESLKASRRAERLQPDPYERALDCISTALIMTRLGRYRAAFANFSRSALLAKAYPTDVYLWAHLFANRALTFCATGRVDKAIVDWEGAASLMKEAGLLYRAATYINSIGYELARQGCLDAAEQRLLEALELVERDPQQHAEAAICDSLGYAYAMSGKFKEAERFLRRSARIFESASDKPQLIGTLLHFSLLHQKTRCYDAAQEDAFRALDLATEINSEPLRVEARERLKGVLLCQMQEHLREWFEAHRRLTSPVRLLKRREAERRPTRHS